MLQGSHTIVLIQYASSYQSRSYLDFPSVPAAMDGTKVNRNSTAIVVMWWSYWSVHGNVKFSNQINILIVLTTFWKYQPTAIVKMYEHKLKELNPSVQHITYDISDLYNYIDNLHDICGLVLDSSTSKYDPKDRNWIKSKVFAHLRSQAA